MSVCASFMHRRQGEEGRSRTYLTPRLTVQWRRQRGRGREATLPTVETSPVLILSSSLSRLTFLPGFHTVSKANPASMISFVIRLKILLMETSSTFWGPCSAVNVHNRKW